MQSRRSGELHVVHKPVARYLSKRHQPTVRHLYIKPPKQLTDSSRKSLSELENETWWIPYVLNIYSFLVGTRSLCYYSYHCHYCFSYVGFSFHRFVIYLWKIPTTTLDYVIQSTLITIMSLRISYVTQMLLTSNVQLDDVHASVAVVFSTNITSWIVYCCSLQDEIEVSNGLIHQCITNFVLIVFVNPVFVYVRRHLVFGRLEPPRYLVLTGTW